MARAEPPPGDGATCPPPPPPPPTVSALKELSAHSCTPRDRAAGGGRRALRLSLSPPASTDEFAHERALAFAFSDELKVARQLQLQCREGHALVRDVYCARSCARALPPVPSDASAAVVSAYHMTVFDGVCGTAWCTGFPISLIVYLDVYDQCFSRKWRRPSG